MSKYNEETDFRDVKGSVRYEKNIYNLEALEKELEEKGLYCEEIVELKDCFMVIF